MMTMVRLERRHIPLHAPNLRGVPSGWSRNTLQDYEPIDCERVERANTHRTIDRICWIQLFFSMFRNKIKCSESTA
jgi:hypothetical protein